MLLEENFILANDRFHVNIWSAGCILYHFTPTLHFSLFGIGGAELWAADIQMDVHARLVNMWLENKTDGVWCHTIFYFKRYH